MQDSVYKSKEVRLKFADFLVSLRRFNDSGTDTTFKMVQECRGFLNNIRVEYLDGFDEEIIKMGRYHGSKTKKSE